MVLMAVGVSAAPLERPQERRHSQSLWQLERIFDWMEAA